MEKFSYAYEFYKENIYELDDIKFYENKVKEAEKVEEYYSKILPNISIIRPYIIMSYKLEKVIGYKNRVRYVRGLIYASDYIDFNDAANITSDINMFYEKGLIIPKFKKTSIWNVMEYVESSNYTKILSGNIDELIKLEEDYDEELSDEELEIENNLKNMASDNSVEIDSKNMEALSKIAKENEENSLSDTKTDDDNIESYISIDEKLNRFKENSNIYIDNILKEKIEYKIIKEEDIPMIKRAMKRWFKEIFYVIEKIIEFDSKEYKYIDENIVRFL